MRKRAEQVDETRQRIVDATVRLHTTIGPASTTISGIAEAAGVTRLTVYRHFADEDELFAACSHRWISTHAPPDPSAWARIGRPAERARVGLRELYAWYAANGDDLYPVRRDFDAMPAIIREANHAADRARADALVAGSALRGAARRRLRAAAGHVVGYWTWRSLVVEQGLTLDAAVELASTFLAAAAEPA